MSPQSTKERRSKRISLATKEDGQLKKNKSLYKVSINNLIFSNAGNIGLKLFGKDWKKIERFIGTRFGT
jgi:hypothetical protein